MNEVLFGLLLLFSILIYATKSYISTNLNKILEVNNYHFKIKKIYISYFAFILLIIILIIGMASGTKTKKTFKNVSSGFEKVRAKDDGKPHPMFDIDTYW
jgi:TRAP-type C4-dicarboxylate transport system permease large subunit